ncbi:hypothetical protein L6164_016505 [Bauhinia variegata]|uniref:Uncharacterized protein n=1 Tax=Bauhinia variegata TaxID=167791 RepID=A0ACB9NTB0_BAUVA|nr:hypothetical protein L6164_016505 [Bauhinia variegata]
MCPASSSSRWCPTPEQLMILEEMYRNGVRTPNASQIQHISAHLSFYGKIEGKNVFYWFQNHKARDRQKLRRKLHKQLQLQQQQQMYYQHLSQRNHFPYDLEPVYGSASNISTQQLPFYNSFGSSHQERGAIEAISKHAINHPWKMDKPEGLMENTMLKFYKEDWTMTVNVSPTPCSCPNSLKTLELFPIAERLKAADQCSKSKAVSET